MRDDGWSGPEYPWKRMLPDVLDSAVTFGSDHFYGIAEEVEVVRARHVELITVDCISVRHFWTTLRDNRTLFQVLENYHNAATRAEVANRRTLLRALLDLGDMPLLESVQTRCAVLLFFPPAQRDEVLKRFPPNQWRRLGVTPMGPTVSTLEVPRSVEGIQAVAARDLHGDWTVDVAEPWGQPVSVIERSMLEEIFSLNHVADEPLDGGLTPLVPLTPNLTPSLILSEGKFSIDGEEDFWRGRRGRAIYLPDEDISPYPRPGKAFCKPTKTEYNVVPGDPAAADGEFHILLDDGRGGPRFIITLDGTRLVVSVAEDEETEVRLKVTSEYAYQPEAATMSATMLPVCERCGLRHG